MARRWSAMIVDSVISSSSDPGGSLQLVTRRARSFVMEMQEDAGNATIVQSTIDLGHNLGLEVVAEGVETVESYNTLAKLGCDYAQGYFLSRPLSPDKATIWLEEFSGVVREEPPAAEEPSLGEWMLQAPVEDAPLDDAPLDDAPLDEAAAS